MVKVIHKSKDECDNPDFYRASGECLCKICGEEYFKHPYCAQIMSYEFNSYFLHVLCNGDHVKL